MVSFHTPISPNRRKTAVPELANSPTKKRKREDPEADHEIFKNWSKPKSTKSIFDIELHLETPLPLDWQRCLDIQSGQVHFYNTRTHKRTSKDPRISPDPPSSPVHMSLDLELNLPCESLRKKHAADNFTKHNSSSSSYNSNSSLHKKNNSVGLARNPPWLAFEGDNQEMVATVCKQCFMLVMLCKSSPSCPNCKFLHPPDHCSPPTLFKRRLSLLF